VLRTPAGTFGVAESWEIFFPDRARAAIRDGGEVLLNPTNGASFHGSIIQTQQLASSRLRAIETGRWVLQAAPTGFSAFIEPDGTIDQRTGITERKVLQQSVQRRDGLTIATRVGDWPALVVALGLVAIGWLVERRRPRPPSAEPSDVEQDRDRTVVDQTNLHVGAESTGGDLSAEIT
jgi:apolipoprotein N-acyltransferase